jgi:DNA-binding response OmpR family regulator
MLILVVEDNPKVAQTIAQALEEQGHQAEVVHRGFEGEAKAASGDYAAIVLDLMLPDRDGVEVCRNLRRRGIKTPILMLTALSETSDKVKGLDAGADDYLAKPFEFDELLARLRAVLRRGEATEATVLTFEDIEMDLVKRTIRRAGKTVSLTPKEFALMEYLLRNPNRVLSRTAIAEQVWDLDIGSESNVIDVYISTLRGKIDRPFDKTLIHTATGIGYVLSAEGAPA